MDINRLLYLIADVYEAQNLLVDLREKLDAIQEELAKIIDEQTQDA